MQRLNKTAGLVGTPTRVLISRTTDHIQSDNQLSTNLRKKKACLTFIPHQSGPVSPFGFAGGNQAAFASRPGREIRSTR